MRLAIFALLSTAVVVHADTEERVRKSVPAQPGGKLILTAEMGAIRVQAGTANTVDVEVYFRGAPGSRQDIDKMLKDFVLEVTPQGRDVRVTGRFSSGWVQRLRRLKLQMEYRVSVPAQFSADLSTSGGSLTVGDLKGQVDARTSGGAISVGKVDGPVTAQTSGGSITLGGSHGRAMLKTSGGGITVQGAVGDVDAETSGGSIQVAGTLGRVTARTSGGGITVRESNGPVDASTSGGTIQVALPSNKGFELDASTSGGSVSTDFTGVAREQKNRMHGPVNGGGPLLRLRTSGGSILVKRAG